jgi:hypothetical protein
MIYIFNPIKDATIVEKELTLNTGLDEILELTNSDDSDSVATTSRILIKFDHTTELNSIVNNKFLLSSQTASLGYKLKL